MKQAVEGWPNLKTAWPRGSSKTEEIETTSAISARSKLSKTGTIRATGKVIHFGGKTATAEARLEDTAGKLYAHSTTTCIILS